MSNSGTSTPLSSSSSRSDNSTYFDAIVSESQAHSELDSDSDVDEAEDDGKHSSGASESTLEDEEVRKVFGHPLERISRVRSVYRNEQVSGSENDPCNHHGDGGKDAGSTCSSCCTSRSQSSASMASSIGYGNIDYEDFIETILTIPTNPFRGSYNGELVMYTPDSSSSQPLMLKRLPRSSPELFLLLELNQADLRQDPWNPAPHILCAVERKNDVYLCMERLRAYDHPPIDRVMHWVDFYRQILEGLAFLHEHDIACLSLLHPSTYMVDLSSAPISIPTSPHPLLRRPTLGTTFDRKSYPVRYYITDFSRAVRGSDQASFPPEDRPDAGTRPEGYPSKLHIPSDPFKRDIVECGLFIERTLAEVPPIAAKLKALITAMTVGRFSADDARRLFEALCCSLPGNVFDLSVGQSWSGEAIDNRAEGVRAEDGSAKDARAEGNKAEGERVADATSEEPIDAVAEEDASLVGTSKTVSKAGEGPEEPKVTSS